MIDIIFSYERSSEIAQNRVYQSDTPLPSPLVPSPPFFRPSSLQPPLLVLVTGRGPGLPSFRARLSRSRLRAVSLRCLWLPSFGDYQRLLGCAHLGVSLHTSSMGVDLPMKALDMLGAGMPVLQVHYQTAAELIQGESAERTRREGGGEVGG